MKRLEPGKPVLAKGRAVVGIDVGKRKHAATALTPNGEMIAQLASFANTREGIDLLEKFSSRKDKSGAKGCHNCRRSFSPPREGELWEAGHNAPNRQPQSRSLPLPHRSRTPSFWSTGSLPPAGFSEESGRDREDHSSFPVHRIEAGKDLPIDEASHPLP